VDRRSRYIALSPTRLSSGRRAAYALRDSETSLLRIRSGVVRAEYEPTRKRSTIVEGLLIMGAPRWDHQIRTHKRDRGGVVWLHLGYRLGEESQTCVSEIVAQLAIRMLADQYSAEILLPSTHNEVVEPHRFDLAPIIGKTHAVKRLPALGDHSSSR
jgi:hypothetical protein